VQGEGPEAGPSPPPRPRNGPKSRALSTDRAFISVPKVSHRRILLKDCQTLSLNVFGKELSTTPSGTMFGVSGKDFSREPRRLLYKLEEAQFDATAVRTEQTLLLRTAASEKRQALTVDPNIEKLWHVISPRTAARTAAHTAAGAAAGSAGQVPITAAIAAAQAAAANALALVQQVRGEQ
jgi:hypothetical protein